MGRAIGSSCGVGRTSRSDVTSQDVRGTEEVLEAARRTAAAGPRLGLLDMSKTAAVATRQGGKSVVRCGCLNMPVYQTGVDGVSLGVMVRGAGKRWLRPLPPKEI